MNCPTCDLPMVWSDDQQRVWCSVYGDHRDHREDWRQSPVANLIRLDVRRDQRRAS